MGIEKELRPYRYRATACAEHRISFSLSTVYPSLQELESCGAVLRILSACAHDRNKDQLKPGARQ